MRTAYLRMAFQKMICSVQHVRSCSFDLWFSTADMVSSSSFFLSEFSPIMSCVIPFAVYCEGCVVDMMDRESEKIKCKECHVCDPRRFPKVCLALEQFLEEYFPEEYSSRRSGIQKTLALDSKGSKLLLLHCENSMNHLCTQEIHSFVIIDM